MNAIEIEVDLPLGEAEEKIRAALNNEGFGVLTEIDVAATLKTKLQIDRAPMKILGACNPMLAHRALTADPGVALLMPCNIVLEEIDGKTRISAADPMDLLKGPACDEVGVEAAARIRSAVNSLAG